MSIAASVTVLPSRLLVALVAMLCACIAAIGGAVSAGLVGELTSAVQMGLMLLCLAVAVCGFVSNLRGRKIYHLDISGTGQIRLGIQPFQRRKINNLSLGSPDAPGNLVTLLADSTLWPQLLLLRLRSDDGATYIVPIFPDSVSDESFRIVSVACRWIAAHRFSELN